MIGCSMGVVDRGLLAAGPGPQNPLLECVVSLLAHFPRLLLSSPARLKCVCLTQPLDGVFPFPLFILSLLCFVKALPSVKLRA